MVKTPERCSDVKELNKLIRVLLELALVDIKGQGVNPLVVETYRTQQRQNYLYCQGRTITEATSKGINKSFAEAYCNTKSGKVTWILNSVHKSRKAIDVVPQRVVNGRMTAIWNTRDPQTQVIIKTMQKYGFEAGANWVSNPDSPHFQIKGNFSSVFKKGKTTDLVTKVIQKALGITMDGIWGEKTTAAVNRFRKDMGYKNTSSGQLGTRALTDLLMIQ